ncbi:MAG TPA: DUF1080 domain-containing protein [Chitinophagaceae bacterium]|jgi:hypothetical protein
MKKVPVNGSCRFSSLVLIPVTVLLFTVLSVKANKPAYKKADVPAIIGRWDITIDFAGKKFPSWLEVHHSGNKTLVGEFVGVGGSARPVSKVNFDNGQVSFSIPPQWEQGDGDISLAGTLQGDNLSGTITFSDGKTYNFSAVRAPSLKRTSQPVWGKAVPLFNGKDLKGWHMAGENQWVAENGVLKSPHSGANLITDDTFNDFKLHIEFRYPKGSNSGVYLRGRYEMQIEDDEPGQQLKEQLGAIYGFIAPSEKAGKGPGEWQTYDITLIGRMLTVQLNGKTIICDREIPGITGGAINSNESEPGPLYIQGDHGPIEYRNIVITPAQ